MHISTQRNALREIQKKCHDGEGQILFREVLKKEDFESNLQHFHETIVYPHSTIGNHLHKGNEEIYYIVRGEGTMIVDGEEVRVFAGDAVITHSGSHHGLINDTDEELKILVFQCNYHSTNDKI